MSEYRKAAHSEAVDVLSGLQRGLYFGEVGICYEGMKGLTPENFVERHNAMSLEEMDEAGRITDVSFLTAKEGGRWINVHATEGGFLEVWIREDDAK